ncbi:M20 family metallopeptidase [Kitasatospora sp. RB6PN24]|uniref:M20 metallopeptidase family protein n=1 Tax=Kitasatospora humi TaxID=2893891 RepID=UPI001E3D7B7A|nr:M20 family metallopeptidase [Kitasatospora humi]MCC9308831.1 M20 family metallopeptidase [Kitasatospora humi]
MDLRESAAALQPDLVALRRDLHAVPELGLRLPRTQRLVLAALDGLPLEVTRGRGLDSVTAVLRGAGDGPTVLLRGDMDALPVPERPQPGGPVSSIPGRMHACGHDLHTAMLVGAARLLAARRAELPGDVVFMFQPAEETDGGAQLMIEEGVLTAAGADRPVAAAYALHVFSGLLPSGQVAVRRGTAMAAADQLRVVVRGRGGHGSAPHAALDPVPAACEAVTALQTAVTRSFSIFDPVVVSVGTFHAGEVANVIPDEARFTAIVRTFSPAARERAMAVLPPVVHGVAAAHGLTADVEYHQGYPVTVNHPEHADRVAGTVRTLFGADRLADLGHPQAGAEDFSYVLQRVPGAYFFLGALLPGRDLATAPYNHSPEAAFDEAVLADGAALLAALALNPLT